MKRILAFFRSFRLDPDYDYEFVYGWLPYDAEVIVTRKKEAP